MKKENIAHRQTQDKPLPPFMKIRDAAKYSGFSEFFIRRECRKGTIPFIMAGDVYMIDFRAMVDTLQQRAQETTEKSKKE